MAVRKDISNVMIATKHYYLTPPPPPLPVTKVLGNLLSMDLVSRHRMGAYLCIASNGVPPTVSKRITLNVNCEFVVLNVNCECIVLNVNCEFVVLNVNCECVVFNFNCKYMPSMYLVICKHNINERNK